MQQPSAASVLRVDPIKYEIPVATSICELWKRLGMAVVT
jgi:hypothetical protein